VGIRVTKLDILTLQSSRNFMQTTGHGSTMDRMSMNEVSFSNTPKIFQQLERPLNWTFYDDKLPKWHAEWMASITFQPAIHDNA
jgi:hypothetical protein